MARIRTARALAAVAAVPLAVALFGGVAAADNGAFASDGSNAGVATLGSGVGGDNSGNASTSQQQAVGAGASNHNNTVQVSGGRLTYIEQATYNFYVIFPPLWAD
ncbi:hypothetical protein [Streptomyces sp. NPDC048590]|uniref:hypothetical protein n=1 Tax=Streptomyces sp. NPDC048590 TaxID=3365574 RepID=UPI00371D9D68